jgi:hypothetical protein
MKIRSLLPVLIISMAALAAGSQAHANPIASYTNTYVVGPAGAFTWTFTYGINENLVPGTLVVEAPLFSTSFSDSSIWGTLFTLNADNASGFAAFTSQLTDGETDWFIHRMVKSNGASVSQSPEPVRLYGNFNDPQVDLYGHTISQITVGFSEWVGSAPPGAQLYGRYTVSFFETASVPDAGSAGWLLGATVLALAAVRRLRA